MEPKTLMRKKAMRRWAGRGGRACGPMRRYSSRRDARSMADITRSIYAAKLKNIRRAFLSIRRVSLCISCVFAAYWRVFACLFAAYPAYSRVFLRILAYSRVFSAYSSAYSRVFSRIHPRILAYSPRILAYSPRIRRVFSRIRRVFARYSRMRIREVISVLAQQQCGHQAWWCRCGEWTRGWVRWGQTSSLALPPKFTSSTSPRR